ncbi:hypothetical protein DDE82_004505 [Stemphylium lycopersici]|nr:hypothetical protein DDE82_004505 [Stemphylium lycopersici]
MASPNSDHIIIEPTGETLLILDTPGAKFAVWTAFEDVDDGSHDTNAEDIDDEFFHQDGLEEEITPNWTKWEEHDMSEEEENIRRRADSPLPSVSMIWEEHSTHSTAYDSVNLVAPPALVYQISSTHLITASPRFKEELASQNEGCKDENGLFHLKASRWDPDAFTILLNVLHTRYRRVPKELSLEMVAKIAVMIDYYRCGEAFELISEIWIRHLRAHHSIPKTYNRDLMLWVLVSWVFKLPKEFSRCTARALRQCTQPSIQYLELGIPPVILQAIQTRRSSAIAQVLETCNYWIDEFSDTYTCKVGEHMSFECSSMLLGALMKQMKGLGFLSPRAIAPFDGFSLESMAEGVKGMRSPVWETYNEVNELYPISHSCSLETTVVRDLGRVVARVKGLVLEDFLDEGEGLED